MSTGKNSIGIPALTSVVNWFQDIAGPNSQNQPNDGNEENVAQLFPMELYDYFERYRKSNELLYTLPQIEVELEGHIKQVFNFESGRVTEHYPSVFIPEDKREGAVSEPFVVPSDEIEIKFSTTKYNETVPNKIVPSVYTLDSSEYKLYYVFYIPSFPSGSNGIKMFFKIDIPEIEAICEGMGLPKHENARYPRTFYIRVLPSQKLRNAWNNIKMNIFVKDKFQSFFNRIQNEKLPISLKRGVSNV